LKLYIEVNLANIYFAVDHYQYVVADY